MAVIPLSAFVRKERVRRKWSQTELGSKIGLSQQRVAQIEKGVVPSEEALQEISAVFKVDIADVLTMSTLPDTPYNEQEKNLLVAARSKDMKKIMKIAASIVYG